MPAVAGKKYVKHGIIHIPVGMPRYNDSVLEAMAEAKRISIDPDIKSYSTMEELKAALEAE